MVHDLEAVREGPPGASARSVYRIRSASGSVLAEMTGPRDERADADGLVNVRLRPDVGVRRTEEGRLRLVTPRDRVGRTLEEALEADWARIVEPKPRRRRERSLTREQVDALHRTFSSASRTPPGHPSQSPG